MGFRWRQALRTVKTIALCAVLTGVLTGCAGTVKTEEAMKLIDEMDYQGALELFDQAKEEHENVRLIERGKGIAYMGLTDYEQAIECFTEALSLSNGLIKNVDFDINYYLAAAYLRVEDYQSAENTYDAIIALRSEEKEAYFLRGNVRMALDKYEQAKEDFDKVVSMDPNNYDRLINIYEILAHYGYKEIGKEYLQTALKNGEKKMNAYDIGRIYYYMEEYQKAYIALEEAKTKGGFESYLYLGKAYEATGDYNYAVSVYNSYLGKAGDNAQVYNQLGLCEMKLREYRKALDAFQAGLALNDRDMQQALSYNEVVACEYLNDYKQAAEKLSVYLRNYPDDAVAQREYIFLSTR